MSDMNARRLLVGRVPLLGLAEVATVVTADTAHRVHGVVERLAVATEVPPAALAVVVEIDDEEGSFRAGVSVPAVDVEGPAVRTCAFVHSGLWRARGVNGTGGVPAGPEAVWRAGTRFQLRKRF